MNRRSLSSKLFNSVLTTEDKIRELEDRHKRSLRWGLIPLVISYKYYRAVKSLKLHILATVWPFKLTSADGQLYRKHESSRHFWESELDRQFNPA